MSRPIARSKTERVYLDNESQQGYSVDAYEEFHRELYGDDADGNRGEMRWFSDGVTIEKWYYMDKEISEPDERIVDKMNDILEKHEFEPQRR